MIIPRFGFTSIDGSSAEVDNPRLAATIYAFDVPLHADNPYSTAVGDGIDGIRVTWHFEQSSPCGNSPKLIAKYWSDQKWILANPSHPLTLCKGAFALFDHLVLAIKQNRGFPLHFGAACRITNTRKAAVMQALGHPIMGWLRNEKVTTWCFPEAAATDALLYDDEKLYERLPDAPISYLKGALLGHEAMTVAMKDIQFARVEHRGRVAMIGKHIPKKQLDQIERILFRK